MNVIASIYLSPITCPDKIPTVRKIEIPIPMVPRKAVGAISAKNIGSTHKPMPGKRKGKPAKT